MLCVIYDVAFVKIANKTKNSNDFASPIIQTAGTPKYRIRELASRFIEEENMWVSDFGKGILKGRTKNIPSLISFQLVLPESMSLRATLIMNSASFHYFCHTTGV